MLDNTNNTSGWDKFLSGTKMVLSKIAYVLKKVWPPISTLLKVAVGAAATVLLICVVCGFVFMGILGNYLQTDILPSSVMDMEGYDLDQNSFLYYVDENGEIQVLQKVHASISSEWAEYEDIPQDLIHAAVAIEDHRFYEHQGVDWITTIKACARMFLGDDSAGGSSITQQLIKNMRLLNDDDSADDVTVRRKVIEIFRAVQMEKRYDKKVIMEYYLNCISLGQGCQGVRSAAAVYFGKELESLTTAECASLISITNSPTYYDPYQNFDNNMRRKDNVLWAMHKYGWLTTEEYNAAKNQTIVLKSGIDPEDKMTYCPNEACGNKELRRNLIHSEDGHDYCVKCNTEILKDVDASQEVYSWYTDTVLEDVAKALATKEGVSWNDETKRIYMQKIQRSGYHIYTCLDMQVQEQVDKIYTDLTQIPRTWSSQQLQSAIVVVDNRTGDIVALSGGVGEKDIPDQWNRATDANLQSGSSIKPLSVYAPAFEAGVISPASVMPDRPLFYTSGAWPRNADYVYWHQRTILSGVVNSTNAVAAHTLNRITTDYGYDFAKNKFRLTSLVDSYIGANGVNHTDNGYAPLAMGAQTFGVRVRDMSCAFATFANNGVYRQGRTFTKVLDRDGNVVIDNVQVTEQILSEKSVNYMNYCLVNATQSGTGTEANLSWSYGITTAGKTGSTADYKDRWYCGYTGYYTAAVWCGYDTPAVISGVSGNPASQLWKKVMGPLHAGKTNIALYDSSKFAGVSICAESGGIATSACNHDIRSGSGFTRVLSAAAYPEDLPGKYCTKHVMVEYCSGGGVATEYCKHFAEVDSSVVISETALVKMTPNEIAEIKQAAGSGLKAEFYNDNYVFYVDANGKNLDWKGFSGNANKNVSAPYVVCTKHTEETWREYQESQIPEEPEDTDMPILPILPNRP